MNSRIPALQPEFEQRLFKVYTQRQLDKIEAIQNLPEPALFTSALIGRLEVAGRWVLAPGSLSTP
ncbi:hypothetical protein [Halomonas mongoliensis]|uniref:hypothetical protein n=1 Tax=Halomonas mongoliensis TaxID=321265 RepID=UPI00403B3603